ncbi:hypothetical protein CALCODRAFT_121633 [Calocera cornea HHB12733]|uniref:Uncharacterized protein n=1 Tax=Calocera cornea HHB12733 TaxID=1353952 RepID=A0A165CZC0_9BASI|nr:hypothetical protein CALCODRAFT_121633 [Calocera cornea HHB12733]
MAIHSQPDLPAMSEPDPAGVRSQHQGIRGLRHLPALSARRLAVPLVVHIAGRLSGCGFCWPLASSALLVVLSFGTLPGPLLRVRRQRSTRCRRLRRSTPTPRLLLHRLPEHNPLEQRLLVFLAPSHRSREGGLLGCSSGGRLRSAEAGGGGGAGDGRWGRDVPLCYSSVIEVSVCSAHPQPGREPSSCG